jgi:hypothetical protein
MMDVRTRSARWCKNSVGSVAAARRRGYCCSKNRKTWTPAEDAYLQQNWGRLSGDEICGKLGRSYNSINLRRKRLGAGSTRDRVGAFCIRDLETLTGIDHRHWHDFVQRG